MNTIALRISAVVVAVSLLGACSSDMGQKQMGGGLIGGAAGGLAGAQFGHGSGKIAAAVAGTLIGAFIGSEAGKSLDRADQAYAQRAEQQAYTAPVGQTIRWNNPENGNQGSFTPTREGTDTSSGAYCREYQSTVVIGGQSQQAYGTACRQPDGSWKVVK
jgi:surface antigen